MATREEIRGGIINAIKSSWEVDMMQIHDNYDLDEEKATDKILRYLHSQGVVIKVDRECDNCHGTGKFTFVRTDVLGTYEGDCLKCGGMGKLGEIVAVEPLI